MPRSQVNAASVIELAPRLQPSRPARRPGDQTVTVVLLRPGSPVPLPPDDARAPSDIPHAEVSGLKRLRSFFERLIARIDLTVFPGSCCG